MAYLNISNVWQLIKEAKDTYNENLDKYVIDNPKVFVANSGGKDSGATDLLAMEILEGNYESVACDTGNEHPSTIHHLKTLHEQRGGNPVNIISADYDESLFERRRKRITKDWQKKQMVRAGAYRGNVMPSLARTDTAFAELWRNKSRSLGFGEFDCPLDAALSVLHKTGNPFLDMCLLHGGFPLGRNRYCTDELKIQVARDKVYTPALEDSDVVIWSGVRGDESDKRASYERFSQDKSVSSDCGGYEMWNFLPIHKWSAADVFATYKYLGVKPNPLYKQGMGRVGCMPCILVNKEELAETAARFPEEIDRIEQWEKKVALVSRWIHWMIVGHVNRRQFKGMVNQYSSIIDIDEQGFECEKLIARGTTFRFGDRVHFNRAYTLDVEAYRGTSFLGPRGGMIGCNVRDVVEWSKTGRGGKVYDLVTEALTQDVCSSKYGLCE